MHQPAGIADRPLGEVASRRILTACRCGLERLSNLRLGTYACAILVGAVLVTLVAMTVLTGAALRNGERRQASEQLDWAARAATIALAAAMPGAVVNWSSEGAAEGLTLPHFPTTDDLYALDWVGAAVNGRVAVMRLEPRSGDFVGRLMSPAGEPTSLAPLRIPYDDAAAAKAGHILLRQHDGRVTGMLLVALESPVAVGDDLLQLSGLMLGLFLLVCGGGCLLLRCMLAPITSLTATLDRMSAGDYTPAAPGRPLGREARSIAEAAEIFRRRSTGILALGERVAALQVEIRAHEAANRALAQDIEKALDAAIAGDFSRPMLEAAPAPFAGLPQRLNALLDICRRSLGATGAVLDGLAGYDLSVRATGDFGGAFGSLQRDANAVADRMAALIAQLRGKAYGLRNGIEAAACALDLAGEGADIGAEALVRAAIAIERSREQALDMDNVLGSFSFARAPLGNPARPDAYRVFTEYSHSFGPAPASPPLLAVVGGKDWALSERQETDVPASAAIA